MSLTQRAPKYTLLNSGYLERLIRAFGLVKYNLFEGQIILASNDENSDQDDEEYDITVDDPNPIFLWTGYQDACIYCPHDLDIEKYKGDILKVLSIERSERGLIMFENEGNTTYDKVKLLGRQNYCGCFGVMGMKTYFDGYEFFALEYEIDGESG